MPSKDKYDIIICGAGCAGLSLLVHLIHSGKFSDTTILLVDKEHKDQNNRTWCFWEQGAGIFEELVRYRWRKAWIHGEQESKLLDLAPYEYKMIRGIDFYNYCFSLIRRQPNIEYFNGSVDELFNETGVSGIILNGRKIEAGMVFNSIIFKKPELRSGEHWFLQHFKGYVIETGQNIFNPSEATLMDFRVDQQNDTRFVYILPFSTTAALVEYTVFSENVMNEKEYDSALHDYISNILKIPMYSVRESELGIIPMTNHVFKQKQGRIINIGTAGGWTKASTGYTFRFIQKYAAAIVQALNGANVDGGRLKENKRFKFYDSVLLEVLFQQKVPGSQIFSRLFLKNNTKEVLKFLDNESRFSEELKIVSTLPVAPFLKAAIKQL